MFQIGSYNIDTKAIAAPMAGITDQPFRALCRQLGAGLTVSEMITADTSIWHSAKSSSRLNHHNQPSPRSIQIAGSEPTKMANAATMAVQAGADIIDINMGCPAKKVCNKAAGSALLKDESLVADILKLVVKSVQVPVTLKIRTGWSSNQKNALQIAKIAEDKGIQALVVHGRTRACQYNIPAEYDSIASIASNLSIPVIANGDIDSAEKAKQVLEYTGCSAVMIGRAARGNPWIFKQINHYLQTGQPLPSPKLTEIKSTISTHIQALHNFYGDYLGVRIARKHFGWYIANQPNRVNYRTEFNKINQPTNQIDYIEKTFNSLMANVA